MFQASVGGVAIPSTIPANFSTASLWPARVAATLRTTLLYNEDLDPVFVPTGREGRRLSLV